MYNSKRPRRSPRFTDWISDLPDSILGQILSRISTKMAARTNVLSKRWRYIFPYHVQPLNLQLIRTEMETDNENFMNFVSSLLIKKLPHSPCLDELMVDCENIYEDDAIISWISSALECKVQRLTLDSIRLKESKRLFDMLNCCATLVELRIQGFVDLLLPPGKFSMPNLKTLSLEHLKFHRETESIQELLDGCPALEHLAMYGCYLTSLEIIRIESHLLKYLDLGRGSKRTCKLFLDAPNLETFLYDGGIADYTVSCFRSLRKAEIGIYDYEQNDNQYFDDCVAKLVAACSTTNSLKLFYLTFRALERSSLPLPTFQNLNNLTLGRMGIGELLARLLLSAPHLKVITFSQEMYTSDYATFESLLPCAPQCVENNVEKIHFMSFGGEEDEFKLIKYFLKNGKNLRDVNIIYSYQTNAAMSKRLSMLRRQSKMCRIKVRKM